MTATTQSFHRSGQAARTFTQMLVIVFAAFTLFTVSGISFSGSAQAESASYNKGYRDGKKAGQKHGYQDGFKDAYHASYIDELLNGNSRYRTANASWADYKRGYKQGYKRGYNLGWRSGQRDGGDDGSSDAASWKDKMRDKMRNCMRYGNCG